MITSKQVDAVIIHNINWIKHIFLIGRNKEPSGWTSFLCLFFSPFRSNFSKWRWRKRPKSSKIYSKRWVVGSSWPVTPKLDLVQVFIIQRYSCVCFCNSPKTSRRAVCSSSRTGSNWSTSPECIVDAGVLFDRSCDCDCHGSCGWQIASLSAASALCLPPPPFPPACTTVQQLCFHVNFPSPLCQCWVTKVWHLLWHFRKKNLVNRGHLDQVTQTNMWLEIKELNQYTLGHTPRPGLIQEQPHITTSSFLGIWRCRILLGACVVFQIKKIYFQTCTRTDIFSSSIYLI